MSEVSIRLLCGDDGPDGVEICVEFAASFHLIGHQDWVTCK